MLGVFTCASHTMLREWLCGEAVHRLRFLLDLSGHPLRHDVRRQQSGGRGKRGSGHPVPRAWKFHLDCAIAAFRGLYRDAIGPSHPLRSGDRHVARRRGDDPLGATGSGGAVCRTRHLGCGVRGSGGRVRARDRANPSPGCYRVGAQQPRHPVGISAGPERRRATGRASLRAQVRGASAVRRCRMGKRRFGRPIDLLELLLRAADCPGLAG